MEFTLTAEQTQLRDMLHGFLAARHPFEARTRVSRSEPGWNAELWQAFAEELGLLGAVVPEAAGGLGGGAVDAMVIMEELGESLVLEPVLETAVVAAGLLARAEGRTADLSAIARGETRFALAWYEPATRFGLDAPATRAVRDGAGWVLDGAKSVVVGAPWATHLLVSARTDGGVTLFVVDPAGAGVTMQAYPTIDGRRAAEIAFSGVRLSEEAVVGAVDGGIPLLAWAEDAAIAALGAEAVGVMRRLLRDTIDYTRQRRQFGQPIAGFQVLQHRMVDMHMQLELATSAVYLATLSLDAAPEARARAASIAKVIVAKACRFVGQNAVQLHGGMGMSDELAVTHYFKRATVIESEFGTADRHLARFARLSRTA